MAETMVQKVARAMMDVNEKSVGRTFRELNHEMARAAIRAMNKPNQRMRAAAQGKSTYVGAYAAMMDAALEEPNDR